MSNAEFKLIVVALLGVHLAVLALTAILHTRSPVTWLVGADAAAVLAWMALHPRAFHAPIDWPVVALAVFEALVLITAALALRGVRLAGGAVWLAFALHTVASGLAVAFALTFKMTRLI
jgi:hypothetical protein